MPKLSILTPTIRPEGLNVIQFSLGEQTFQDFEWVTEVGMPWKGCDLSAAMNRMLKRAKGDIIVSWQDHIMLEPDALEKIVENHRMSEKTAFTYPVIKFSDEGRTMNRRPDWRMNTRGEIPYHQWETDLASAPIQMFRDIGGYDEEFDQGWSWDNVNVGHRAHMAGYTFRCFPDVIGSAWDHDEYLPHPFRGKKENGNLSTIKSVEIQKGNWKLNYL